MSSATAAAAAPIRSEARAQAGFGARLLVFVLFFCSGMAGLIYEVVWSRHLTYRFGATLDAVTAILVAFMGGLALGAWLLGKRADRSRHPLALYGRLEILIGLSALALPWLLEIVSPVYRFVVNSGLVDGFMARRLLRFGLTILLLLIPTTAMGATLPALSRFLARNGERLGFNVGGLYSLNTLGAVAGAFLSGFFLVEYLGVKGSLWVAVVLNVAAGAIALALSAILGEADDFQAEDNLTKKQKKKRKKSKREAKKSLSLAPGATSLAAHPRLIAMVYGVSGFAALAFQVVWFRSLVFNFQLLRNTTYSFSAMLTVFLVGVAGGSILMTPLVDKIRRPCLAFGLLEALIGICGLWSFAAVYYDLPRMDVTGPMPSWWHSVQYLFTKTAGAILPATFAMGLLFPVAARCYIGGAKEVGSDVGRLYAANTVGAIFGAFLATFLIVPLFGAAWAILALSGLALLLAAVVFMLAAEIPLGARAGLALLAVAATPAFAARFAPNEYPIALHQIYHRERIVFAGDEPMDAATKAPRVAVEPRGPEMLYYADGPMGTISVLDAPAKKRTIYVDNVGVAGTAPAMLTDQKSLAHVPMLFVPDPKKVLTVGFGSGGASYSFSTYPQLDEIHCVEIDPTVPRAAMTLSESNQGFVAPRYAYPDGTVREMVPPAARERLRQDGKKHVKPLPHVWDWLPAERDFRPTEEEARLMAEAGNPPRYEDRRPPEGSKLLGYYAADERYRLILDDARDLLQSGDTLYDVIATDCTDLSYKSNANLYDLQYFKACRDSLTGHGLMVVWMPLGNLTVEMFRLTLRTFATAFPKWGVWFMSNEATHYCLLIGWREDYDFKIDIPTLESRIAIPAVNRDLAELNLNSAEKILSCYVADHRTLQEWLGEGPLNTEDNPILEFDVPRRIYEHHQIIDNLDAMLERRNDVMDYAAGPAEAVESMRERLKPWEAAEPHIIAGHRLYREGQSPAACAEYMKAYELCPQDKSVEVLLDFRDLKWLADDGRRPKFALWLAELYEQQGRTEDALRYADRLLRAEVEGFDSWHPQAKKDWNEWLARAQAVSSRLRGDAPGDAPANP